MTLRTAFSLALNQEGWGREGWAKCSVKANGKSKIIVFAFFITQSQCMAGEQSDDVQRGKGSAGEKNNKPKKQKCDK